MAMGPDAATALVETVEERSPYGGVRSPEEVRAAQERRERRAGWVRRAKGAGYAAAEYGVGGVAVLSLFPGMLAYEAVTGGEPVVGSAFLERAASAAASLLTVGVPAVEVAERCRARADAYGEGSPDVTHWFTLVDDDPLGDLLDAAEALEGWDVYGEARLEAPREAYDAVLAEAGHPSQAVAVDALEDRERYGLDLRVGGFTDSLEDGGTLLYRWRGVGGDALHEAYAALADDASHHGYDHGACGHDHGH